MADSGVGLVFPHVCGVDRIDNLEMVVTSRFGLDVSAAEAISSVVVAASGWKADLT